MKFVEIYKLENDGSQSVLATCSLTENGVSCAGNELFVENLAKEGIADYISGSREKLFPKDGLRFLENLKYAFKSGYLNASDVLER